MNSIYLKQALGFILIAAIGCTNNSTPDNSTPIVATIENKDEVTIKDLPIYELEHKNAALNVSNDSTILGFKFTMNSKQFDEHLRKLIKENKVKSQKNNDFTFVISDEYPHLLGLNNYVMIDSFMPRLAIDVILYKDIPLSKSLKRFYDSNLTVEQDSIGLKQVNSLVFDYHRQILDILTLKYSDKFKNEGVDYAWFFGGKEIKFTINSVDNMASSHIGDQENFIRLGTIEYTDLKGYKAYLEKFSKEEEIRKQKEKEKKIKNLNI